MPNPLEADRGRLADDQGSRLVWAVPAEDAAEGAGDDDEMSEEARIFGRVIPQEPGGRADIDGVGYIDVQSDGCAGEIFYEAWFHSEIGTVIGPHSPTFAEAVRALENAMIAMGMLGHLASAIRYKDEIIESMTRNKLSNDPPPHQPPMHPLRSPRRRVLAFDR